MTAMIETPPASPHQVVLVVDDERDLLTGLGLMLCRDGRSVILCRDVEGARLIIDTLPVTHVLSDVRLTGPFEFEGLGFTQYVRERSPETFVIIMTGLSTPALQREAYNRGSVAFLEKPFTIARLESLIATYPHSVGFDSPPPPLVEMPVLDEILASGLLRSVFQPIHRLGTWQGSPFGFECLTRLSTESPLSDPSLLFRYASDKRRLADLEVECLVRACHAAAPLVEPALLFINIHPQVLSEGWRVIRALAESPFPLNRVVLEITEQGPMRDEASVWETIAELARRSVRFAFDDVGMAYSHFEHMARVRPSFLKVSQNFGSGFERDHVNETIVRSVLHLANNLSIQLILEGIETEATLARAIELDIPLGQGYFFGRPGPLEAS
jgi:EAL domain-containing protein (putative c-di-GMP-specific phosphodiesterase class I)/ActR/RegA family two-component response regulator